MAWVLSGRVQEPSGRSGNPNPPPPKGPKYPKYEVFRVSILGIVTMVLARYLVLGYLDPWGPPELYQGPSRIVVSDL